ncbi:MAG TPA: acetylxylan esterase, partial [Candidatus Kapabacteria bacterium]|nr:acetylxylan esterase [Candidatus Kapabacteria bacterium]
MRHFITVFLLSFAITPASLAQTSKPPVNFTAEQDHQNMMDQLGIKSVRPGPSGDESAPNHANYDESKANPYPNLPDPLTMNNGQKVTTAKMWWDQRRPEIVDMYEKYVYGRIPANVPKVTWTVKAVDHEMIGFTHVIAKDVIGQVDNSAYPTIPKIDVKIHMTVVTPEYAKGPVPVLMMFGPAGFPNPHEPSADEFARINTALQMMLIHEDPSLKDVFEKYPAWELAKATPFRFP